MPRCDMLDSHACVKMDGIYAPCCVYDTSKNEKLSVEHSIDDYLKSKSYKKIKTNMETDWDPGCLSCKYHEDKGVQSHRDRANDSGLTGEYLEYVELSVSNECNISCRSCNPTWSSKWESLLGKQETKDFDLYKIFKNTDISKLRLIKYLGGEPFITPQINDLFSFLDEKKVLENVEFLTLTNCTYYPKKYEEVLNRFKKVNIAFSIDGFEKSNEYSRTGTNWSVMKDNMLKWLSFRDQHHNMNCYIHTTVGAYNVHDYSKLKNFANQHSLALSEFILQKPEYLTMNALPKDYVESIIDENNKKFFKDYTFNNTLNNILINKTNEMDVLLKQNIKEYIPNLAGYLNA